MALRGDSWGEETLLTDRLAGPMKGDSAGSRSPVVGSPLGLDRSFRSAMCGCLQGVPGQDCSLAFYGKADAHSFPSGDACAPAPAVILPRTRPTVLPGHVCALRHI